MLTAKKAGHTTLRFVEKVTGLTGSIDLMVGTLTEAEALTLDSVNLITQVDVINEVDEEDEVIESNEYLVLDDTYLTLNFNKALKDLSYQLVVLTQQTAEEGAETDDGLLDGFGWTYEEVAAEYSTDLDQLTIIPVDGFQEAREYTLILAADSTKGSRDEVMVEDLILTFTYYAAPEDIDFTVVNKAVTDESIFRFYWSSTNFAERIQGLHNELQINERFYHNVVLNRISTDTEMDSWLRFLAPSYPDKEIPFGQIYWGTTNLRAVGLQVLDYSDFNIYSRLLYENYLTVAPENTFPFVTSVVLINKDGEEVKTVGNEEITIRVTFNRDMDTTIPLKVSFGSAYPFNDYIIEGEYVDARTWEAKHLLTTVIENGNQYFSIGGGKSATEDLELFTDWGRFTFVLDTAAAQALIMQGEATDTGIQLTWTQDDFETLMGYNVYRSTQEDGYYTKINKTVIPADVKEFFDDGVEPGVVYYYNFTVVQTDLTESIPSGKISIMSKDTMKPNVYHTTIGSAFTGSNLVISAIVTDNLRVTGVNLYYRTVGETTYRKAVMNNMNDKYTAIIPADHLSPAGLEYYIEATDGVSYNYSGTAADPHWVQIQQAVGADALGDVNGDGVITNLDALILLQAINDLYNMSAEEFARADLDGNGELQAKEAMRILDYVSGNVGSVVMN